MYRSFEPRVYGKKSDEGGEKRNSAARNSPRVDFAEGFRRSSVQRKGEWSSLDQIVDPDANNGRSPWLANKNTRLRRERRLRNARRDHRATADAPSQLLGQNSQPQIAHDRFSSFNRRNSGRRRDYGGRNSGRGRQLTEKDSSQLHGQNSQPQVAHERFTSDNQRNSNRRRDNGDRNVWRGRQPTEKESSQLHGQNSQDQDQVANERSSSDNQRNSGRRRDRVFRRGRSRFQRRVDETSQLNGQNSQRQVDRDFQRARRAYSSNLPALPCLLSLNLEGNRERSFLSNQTDEPSLGSSRKSSFENDKQDDWLCQMNAHKERSLESMTGFLEVYDWASKRQRHHSNGHHSFGDQDRVGRGNRKPAVNKKGASNLKRFDSLSSINFNVNDGGVYSDEEDDYNMSPAKTVKSGGGIIMQKQSDVVHRKLNKPHFAKEEVKSKSDVHTDSLVVHQLPGRQRTPKHVTLPINNNNKKNWPEEEVYYTGDSPISKQSVVSHVVEEEASLFVGKSDREFSAGDREVLMPSTVNGDVKGDVDPLLLAKQLSSCKLEEVGRVHNGLDGVFTAQKRCASPKVSYASVAAPPTTTNEFTALLDCPRQWMTDSGPGRVVFHFKSLHDNAVTSIYGFVEPGSTLAVDFVPAQP